MAKKSVFIDSSVDSVFAYCLPRVVRPDLIAPCMEWQRGKDTYGYGAAHFGGKVEKIHRVVWRLMYGLPPKEKPYVLHRCDNPPCCEPTHLFVGTHADNMADIVAKGRTAVGDKNGAKTHPELIVRGVDRFGAKLTERDVVEIRARVAGGETARGLAAVFGVCASGIVNIANRKTWRHVK